MGSRGAEDSCCRGGTETGRVWDKRGRQSDHWQTLRPHIHAQINRQMAGSEADRATQGSSAGK